MNKTGFAKIKDGIPTQAGIYQYYDAEGKLLYVGKAKNLRKRISSYFNKTVINFKTKQLVFHIHRIEFTVVNSEQDAFLLENSLIKKFQPRYNINLKDDKSYPFLVIKKEPFPRVFFTHQLPNKSGEFLGPFTSLFKVKELLAFIKQTIPLRNCSLSLTPDNIKKNKFKVCLEYHLGNCKGPCVGLQTVSNYDENLNQLRNILKGNLSPVIQHFKKEMQQHASVLNFENAELIKKKLIFLENYQPFSVVAGSSKINTDVFSINKENDIAFINFLMVRNGAIVQTHTLPAQYHLNETENEILSFAIPSIRKIFNSTATEIIVPFAVNLYNQFLQITIPKAGLKKKLLQLSEKNAAVYQIKEKNKLVFQDNLPEENILLSLQKKLHLKSLPVHIDCFDNSNFQGSYPVSAMVCFKNGLPSKNDYRKYHVKTVIGINDFATMKEVVYRRYSRLKLEKKPLPQLVIIDGGKGQLSAAAEAINQLNLQQSITLISLAKNEEEIFFIGDVLSIKLPLNSPELLLIRRIRNEVHRYGINFHRQIRSKGTFKNELESIKGIGPASLEILLKKYKSVSNIRKADANEIIVLIGASKANLLFNYFKQNST